jgi:hypothetical protein
VNTFVLLLAPVIVLMVVLLLGFVGCNLPTKGTGPELPPYEKVIADEPGLVAWWRLGEGGDYPADDAFGQHPGTYTTAPFAVPPAAGVYILGQDSILADASMKSVYVDGGWVVVQYDGALNPIPAFSIEAWVRPGWDEQDEPAVERVVIASLYVDTANNDAAAGFVLLKTSDNLWAARVGDGTPALTEAADSMPINPTLGFHLVATYDGAALKLYRDGTLVVEQVPASYLPNGSAPFLIGAGEGGQGVVQDPFKGWIQEVALYNLALSPGAVGSHAAAGNWA